MSAPTTPFGKTPTQIPSYRDEFYIPRRPRFISTMGLGISLTTALCCALVILGRPLALVILAAFLGAIATAAVAITTRRHWLKTSVRPAAMRQAIAAVVGQPLPERLEHQARRTLVASRYERGTLITPGPARRIVLNARHLAMLDPARLETITAALRRLEGIQYRVEQGKKNKPGRYIFTPKPAEKAVQLSPREQVEKRMTDAAKNVFDLGARVSFTWDEKIENYLLSVDINNIEGIDYALSGKQNQAGARLLSQLAERDFKYAAFPNEDRFSLFRSRPLPAITMPPATTAPMLVDHKAYHRFEIPLGIGPNGTQAVWHPAGGNGDPHLLIIGGTGGGKTICLHGVIQAATQAAWRVWLIDGKRIEFVGYKNWRNVEFLAQNVDAQIRLIHLAYTTMNTRYDLIQEGKVRIDELDPIMLVIDEVTSMLISVANRYAETKTKGMPAKHPVMVWLGELARLARSAKIHMVWGMQRPDASIFESGEIRDNFSGRISLGALESPAGSAMMWKNHAIGCQIPDIKGRAIGKINGQPTMIQATYNANPDPTHDDHHAGVVAAMTPTAEIYTRKQVKPPVPVITEDENAPEITWANLLDAEIIDSTGQLVVFDPVASDESRRFRAQIHPSTYTTAPSLQPADSREAGLALFSLPGSPQHSKGLDFGAGVAGIISHEFPAPQDAEPDAAEVYEIPQRPTSAPSASAEGRSPAPGAGGDEGAGLTFTVTAAELQGGHYAMFEEVGKEIMISEVYPNDDGSYLVAGYDDEGQEITVETPADSTVQCRTDAQA